MKHLIIATAALALFTLPLAAESRRWKSADGQKTIQGEFVKRDSSTVTIRLENGREIPCELAKLHGDELKWLATYHPDGLPLPEQNAVFDTLAFGDAHSVVLEKLQASKILISTIDAKLIGRVGLNGIFKTRQKVGGQDAFLYFEWSDDEKLTEINLRTASFPVSAYDRELGPSWNQFIQLLIALQGKPLMAAPSINLASIPAGSMLSSHLWRLDNGGTALLGIGREGSNYQVVVRFTREKIEPTVTGGSPKPPGPSIDFDP